MRPRITSFCAALALLSLNACETAMPSQSPRSSATVKAADALPPQELAIGDCGLFVWAAQSRRFILFAQGTDRVTWAKNGVQRSLYPAGDNPVPDINRQFPTQQFIDAAGQVFDLSFTKAAALGQAIRYSQGSWRYKDQDGWDSFTPVYGLSTCITDPDTDTSENLSVSYEELQRPLKLKSKPVAGPAVQQAVVSSPIPMLPAPLAPIPPEPEIANILPALPITSPAPKIPIVKANFIPTPTEDIKPKPVPVKPGLNYYVQIASLKNQIAAENAWAELSGNYDLLQGQTHFIHPVDLGEKGLYFRLQVGAFDRHVTAKDFCEKLKTQSLDCFVIKR